MLPPKAVRTNPDIDCFIFQSDVFCPNRLHTRIGASSGEVSKLATRIDKNSAKRSAPEAGFQAINGCAAQHSGQMCMFQGKNC
jgi:hypothetical protein